MENKDFSFENFAKLDFYNEINGRLLDIANVQNFKRIVDLGCGTGGITKQILNRIKCAKDYVVYAVDSSSSALRVAMRILGKRTEASVNFVQSEVQNFSEVISEPVDAVVYCNSIHYIKEKHSVLVNIGKKLYPGGLLAINTSFFKNTQSDESKKFYKYWMIRTKRILKEKYNYIGSNSKVESRVLLSKEEYVEALENAGYAVKEVRVEPVNVTFEGWHYISSFKDWIEGVLPGIPLKIGRDVMQESLKQVIKDYNIKDGIQRNWLLLTAIKI